ncbi:MAG: ureidoglycolate lyase [Halieaceae bacterium]|nr:ureidoglycolate lyase [Halieaceae bacterium]|tara:strand:- start:135 stop:989 length:855 start_codon:yes stop_codon:yes gene_type:complete
MKLIRVGEKGHERPGILLNNGERIDVSALLDDFTPEGIASLDLDQLQALAADPDAPRLPADGRLGSVVARPGKIVCIGLNYRDHAEESGMEPPPEPVIFFKASSAVCGPEDPIIIPRDSFKTDWEVELAVIIGKRASYVCEADAQSHILGYCLHNDFSERDFQLERSGQWVKGKSCDTFAPLGPYIATRDEIAEPGNLRLWLDVNGERMQDGSTSNLIFDVPYLVSYLSRFMTLEPGDIISTGTPAGVGLGLTPPRYLVPGDVVELGIDGLGSARQTLHAWPGP